MCSHKVLCQKSLVTKLIAEKWQPRTFQEDFDVFYEGQVPNVAIFLTEGRVCLLSPSKRQEIKAPALIGTTELCTQITSDCKVRILGGSKVSIINRVALIQF